MRTKINYHIDRMDFDRLTGKYDSTITFRSAEITITSKTEEEVENAFDSLVNYVHSHSDFRFTMDAQELTEKNNMFSITDYVEVYDKDEYNEIKELYMAWKESLKVQPIQETVVEQTSIEVVEVIAEQNQNTVLESTPVTEIEIENMNRTADLEQNSEDYPVFNIDRMIEFMVNDDAMTYDREFNKFRHNSNMSNEEILELLFNTYVLEDGANTEIYNSLVIENEETLAEQNTNIILEQDQKSIAEQIDIEDLLDRTATIQTSKTTYTGKIYDVNRTKKIIWIETIQDIYELRLADVTDIKLST